MMGAKTISVHDDARTRRCCANTTRTGSRLAPTPFSPPPSPVQPCPSHSVTLPITTTRPILSIMNIRYHHIFLLVNYSFLMVLCRRRTDGVFLNLFMTNPVHVDTEPVSDESESRPRGHPKDVRGSGGSHSDCTEDRECQLGMYCDRHYGLCKPYRTMGQLCRRDSQCAIGYDCMFGRCLIASKPGHRGARCSTDRDCLIGLCCARQHGEKICKPKLKVGQNCFVPDGGLPYWGNDVCPCDEGLICRYSPIHSPSSTFTPSTQESGSPISDDWFNLWNNQNQMKCVQS